MTPRLARPRVDSCAIPGVVGVVGVIGVIGVIGVALGACGSRQRQAEPPPETAVEPLSRDVYNAYLQGRIAMREGEHERAIVAFEIAAHHAPDEAYVAVALIEALESAGHKDEARSLAVRARARWPEESAIWMLNGELFRSSVRADEREGDLVIAIRAFERAVELAPKREDGYLELASAHIAAGHPERAERVYRKLVEIRPDFTEGHYLLARRLLARNATREAEVHLRRVTNDDNRHVDAHLALARLLRADGRRAESLAQLERAFQRRNAFWAGRQLFLQLLEADQRERALLILAALESEGLSEDEAMDVGRLYLAMGEWRAAMRVARQLSSDASSDPKGRVSSDAARLLEAQALAANRQFEEARATLLAVAQDSNAHARSRALMAECFALEGASERALATVEQGLADHPKDPDLIVAHARVHELAGRVSKARDVLARALARRPRNTRLLHASAALDARHGRDGDAARTLDRLLGLDADHARALALRSVLESDRAPRSKRARALVTRAIENAPGDAWVLASAGWVAFRRGDMGRARERLEHAARIAPHRPEFLWRLGQVHRAAGRTDLALDTWGRALALHPEPALQARIQAEIEAVGSPAR